MLNPEVPKDFPDDKTIALDIRVRLGDGRQVDLEMQSTAPEGTRARFLYYWAKNYSGLLTKGGPYSSLRPCISILWFKVSILQFDRFHSTFHLAEDHTREVFVGDIELHVLELPKLHLATADRQAKLDRWARFLRAETTEELEALAAEDAIMNTAKLTLEELSLDPDAQRLARERETAILMHQHLVASAIEAAEVRAEARGEAKGLVSALRMACRLLSIELDAVKLEQLEKLPIEQL